MDDYSVVDDVIHLENAIFGLPLGVLAAGAFRSGAAAGDAGDRIIYDPTNGRLFFDSDGTGAAAQTQFAQLAAGLAMANGEFVVV
jgi:serralysin